MSRKRRVCFVTGTRAEFGLMVHTLEAIRAHPNLQLQIVATGMHLDRRCGMTVRDLPKLGFKPDGIVAWKGGNPAIAAGQAVAALATTFEKLRTEIVLVVGDRVEAFAAASAGALSGRIVAHVHGGDRALGLVDDSLRHAITKLAHIHLPATTGSAQRIRKMGEEPWRIHRVGAPGIDGIASDAVEISPLSRRPFVLLVLHPASESVATERMRARLVLKALLDTTLSRIVIVHPNNDPGADGIASAWLRQARNSRLAIVRTVSRQKFLGLLRDAVAIVGNSSSGVIEAASFGTPAIDVGLRQQGREHGRNLVHVDYDAAQITRALGRIWRNGNPVRFPTDNVYGGKGTSKKIAHVLATAQLDERTRRKLISY